MPSTQALIEKPLPLSPCSPVRLVAFWTPLAIVLRSLWTSPFFQGLHKASQAFLGSLATLSTLWATAYFTASWQLKPLPTDAEIEELGGRRFRRPSDGRVMEYWVSGTPGARTAVVFCHRMDGRLGVLYGRAKVEAALEARDALLVSPSVPSLGATPPYDTLSAKQWLQCWTEDMMFLLREELGAERVYVLGLSWGAQLCLNLAMACQEAGILRGVAPIGGQYWDTRKIRYGFGSDVPKYSDIFMKPLIIRPMAYLLVRPFIPKMGDVAMMPPHEQECLKKHFGEDLPLFGTGMVRGMSYFLQQFWHVGILSVESRDADDYVELSNFDPAVPFHVFLGSEDHMVDNQQPPFLKQVKHAELKMVEGTHAGFPLDEIIAGIMSANTK